MAGERGRVLRLGFLAPGWAAGRSSLTHATVVRSFSSGLTKAWLQILTCQLLAVWSQASYSPSSIPSVPNWGQHYLLSKLARIKWDNTGKMLLMGPSACRCPINISSNYEQKEEKEDGKEGRVEGSKKNQGKRGKRQGGMGFGLTGGAGFINLVVPAVAQAGVSDSLVNEQV